MNTPNPVRPAPLSSWQVARLEWLRYQESPTYGQSEELAELEEKALAWEQWELETEGAV